MKFRLSLLLTSCLLLGFGCRQDSLVGTWESKITLGGVVADRNVIRTTFEFQDDQTFRGEIRNRELIVAVKGKFNLDGDILILSGTQTLIRSAGKGEVGSTKPYNLRLMFDGQKIINTNVEPADDMKIIYERTN